MKKKVRWPIEELISRSIEEGMIYFCEPEDGEILSDEEGRSVEYLIDLQEGRKENSGFQVGKEEMRQSQSLKNSKNSSGQQRVLKKKEEMRMYESLNNLRESLDQQGLLIGEEEDHRCILIIGGIDIFLSRSLVEAYACDSHEEVMHESSEEYAIGPNVLKLTIYVSEVHKKKENQHRLSWRMRRRRY